jgi:hypothetical protein
MRDIETFDGELGLLVAIRRMIREEEGRTPNARRIDQLLDERADAECLLRGAHRPPQPAASTVSIWWC